MKIFNFRIRFYGFITSEGVNQFFNKQFNYARWVSGCGTRSKWTTLHDWNIFASDCIYCASCIAVYRTGWFLVGENSVDSQLFSDYLPLVLSTITIEYVYKWKWCDGINVFIGKYDQLGKILIAFWDKLAKCLFMVIIISTMFGISSRVSENCYSILNLNFHFPRNFELKFLESKVFLLFKSILIWIFDGKFNFYHF